MSALRWRTGLSRGRAAFLTASLLLLPVLPFTAIRTAALSAQENSAPQKMLPSSIEDQALVVRIETLVDVGPNASAWHSENLRYTVPGTPTSVKLASPTATIIVQITPFDKGKDGLVLVTQGQVWVKESSGSISYRSTLNTVSIHYGDKVYFYPFGRDGSGKAPVRLTIIVQHYRAAAGKDDSGTGSTSPSLGSNVMPQPQIPPPQIGGSGGGQEPATTKPDDGKTPPPEGQRGGDQKGNK